MKVRVKADSTGVDLTNGKMSMNPFDEIGLVADLFQAVPELTEDLG